MAMSLGFDRWFLPASLYGPFVQFQPDLTCLLWLWMTKVDFFLTRLVGTIYRLEGLNKRLITCTSALIISPQPTSVICLPQEHRITIFAQKKMH